MRDVTWHPPGKRKHVSDSDDTDVEVDEPEPASNDVSSLREVVNRSTKAKPRPFKITSRSKRLENKYLRNTGQAYNSKGKQRQARQMKELNICRFNCKNRIPEQVRKDLFQHYWQLGSYDKRVHYIASLITVEEKKVEKVRAKKKRSCSFSYHVHWGREVHEKVCKNCFLTIFDERAKFVFLQASKKRDSLSSTIPISTRGTASTPKWSEEQLERVRQHILSFPQYESHYSRNKTSKKFLPSHLSLEKMYSLYCEDLLESDRVCKTIYSKIFGSLNLSFKSPKVDTCTKCDMLQAQIQYSLQPEEKANLEKKLNDHQEQATRAYEQKRSDKMSCETDESLLVLSFDLQQCLPTPLLSSGLAFYKRSLWTFNLTIHNCKENNATCYMWHECTSKRGGNEIASCLYDFIKNLPPTVSKIVLYSDTCGGQNKNSYVSAMFITIMKECPHIQIIDHKFLVPGHTHMECDYDHSIIERAKKKQTIHLPRDYYQMVRLAGKRGQFTVKEMILKNFYNFEKLLKGPLILRKNNINKEKVYWPEITWFRYTQINPLVVQYKKTLTDEDDFQSLSFQRFGRAKDISNSYLLTNISDELLPISVEKKKDLLTLLPFIDSECHKFYKNLPTTETVRADEDPDLNHYNYFNDECSD